jgi:hypothetical protein
MQTSNEMTFIKASDIIKDNVMRAQRSMGNGILTSHLTTLSIHHIGNTNVGNKKNTIEYLAYLA